MWSVAACAMAGLIAAFIVPYILAFNPIMVLEGSFLPDLPHLCRFSSCKI